MAWIGILLSGAYMLVAGGTLAASGRLPIALLDQVLLVSIVVMWIAAAWRSEAWRPRSTLAAPLLGVLAVIAISAALSPVPRIAAAGLVGATVFAALYLLLVRLAADTFLGPRIGAVLTVVPVAIAIAYLVQVGFAWAQFWDLAGHLVLPPLRPAFANLTLGSPNHVAAIQILLVPFAAAVLVARGRRGMAAAVLLLGAITVVVTGSRGGLLGAAAAAIVLAIAVILRVRLARRARVGVLLATGCVLLVLGAVAGSRMVLGGDAVRIEYWRTALEVFGDHSLTGAGPDAWALLKLAEWSPSSATYVVPHPHSLYIQTLAELGLVGVLAAAWLGIAALRMLLRQARSVDGARSARAIGALAGVTGIAAQSTVDVVTIPAISLLVLAVVAMSDEQALARQAGAPRPSRSTTWPGLVILGALVLALPLLIPMDLAWAGAERGRNAAAVGDWATARVALREASALDPLPIYRGQLAIAEAYAGDPAAALDHLDALIAVDGLPHHLVARSLLELESGETDAALRDAIAALERSGGDVTVQMNAGWVAERAGDDATATLAYARALRAAPTLAGSRYWEMPERRVSVQAVVDAAVSGTDSPANDALILAFAGEAGRARARLQDVPPGERDLTRLLVDAAASPDRTTLEPLRRHVQSNPLDWFATAWLSILLRDAAPEEAAELAERAVLAQADSASALLAMPVEAGHGMPGTQFRLYGEYPVSIYRRAGLGPLLPPGAVTLEP